MYSISTPACYTSSCDRTPAGSTRCCSPRWRDPRPPRSGSETARKHARGPAAGSPRGPATRKDRPTGPCGCASGGGRDRSSRRRTISCAAPPATECSTGSRPMRASPEAQPTKARLSIASDRATARVRRSARRAPARLGVTLGGRRRPDRGRSGAAAGRQVRDLPSARERARRRRGSGRGTRAEREGLPGARVLGQRRVRPPVPRRDPPASGAGDARVPGPASARGDPSRARQRRDGARFPWESAGSGRDVTPEQARDRGGELVPVLTGPLEEHIIADVAWAAACYIDWTGDQDSLRPGARADRADRPLVGLPDRTDEHGRGHIRGVIGPDEYHEHVDDNAYTNVMARWNLKRAAEAGAGSSMSASAGAGSSSPTRSSTDTTLPPGSTSSSPASTPSSRS